MKALEEEEREQKENKFAPEVQDTPPVIFSQQQQYQPQQQQFQKQQQFIPNKYVAPQIPTKQQQQQPRVQHTFKPISSVPSKAFQMLERKYSVDSDAGSDSLHYATDDTRKSIY